MSAYAVDWLEANQRMLLAELERVRVVLERHAAGEPRIPAVDAQVRHLGERVSALDTLCAAFELSGFERDLLLLCAGVELDASFAALCAAAQGDPARRYPSFGLALAALDDPHWSALAPGGPLRLWRLIEPDPGAGLSAGPLRIDETVLHYLAGLVQHDDRLAGYLEPVAAPDELPPSQRAIVERFDTIWEHDTAAPVELSGADRDTRRAVAALACAQRGLQLCALDIAILPASPSELAALRRLLEREALLTGSALLLEADTGDEKNERAAAWLAATIGVPLLVSCAERAAWTRTAVRLTVPLPARAEQRVLWRSVLGPQAAELNGAVDALAAQFQLSAVAVRAAVLQAGVEGETERRRDGEKRFGILNSRVPGELDSGNSQPQTRNSQPQTRNSQPQTRNSKLETRNSELDRLWDACREQARPRLEELAQRIEPAASWDELVLPDAAIALLREIGAQVRQRPRVYDEWGFAARGSRGLGISALFAGDSGTGKTMAAEVLASELRLDLYRIDLSSVVSKYIGETEKNLRRVFDAAEGGGAILLFDEADALFGKRSEVKDSHDRYANIEISYLLQRMESYGGLAILTTNLRSALDTAFMRRLRFVVNFPFPDAPRREAIWRRVFPMDTPVAELDYARLARLNVAGGNIRNIALGAAFLAAEAGRPVGMELLLHAARTEYIKLEKTLTDAEWGRMNN